MRTFPCRHACWPVDPICGTDKRFPKILRVTMAHWRGAGSGTWCLPRTIWLSALEAAALVLSHIFSDAGRSASWLRACG